LTGAAVISKGADVYGRLDESKETGTFDAESKSKPVPFCSGLFRNKLSTGALYQGQASVVTEKVLRAS
jgi:hypothetical protein